MSLHGYAKAVICYRKKETSQHMLKVFPHKYWFEPFRPALFMNIRWNEEKLKCSGIPVYRG